MNHRRLNIAALMAVLMVLGSACMDKNPFVHARGTKISHGGTDLVLKGAALMDDATLWHKELTAPSMDAIEERDYAFTALGDLNTVRLVVKMDYFTDPEGNPREAGFAFLDRQLELAAKLGLHLIVDMHIPTGGAIQDYSATEDNQRFWNSPAMQRNFVKGWELIARRYKDDPRIAAYELMNEPAGPADDYWQLMRQVAATIREDDTRHMLIVQATADGTIRPVSDRNVAYSIHFYEPLQFTHQNVPWDKRFSLNEKNAKPTFDTQKIRQSVERMKKLSKRYRVPIIVGEFGISTSAPEQDKRRWIEDVISSVDKLGLNGYIYWRQIDHGTDDLSKPASSTMAIINKGDYFSPAQFFGIRPIFKHEHADFDAQGFYRTYSATSKGVTP